MERFDCTAAWLQDRLARYPSLRNAAGRLGIDRGVLSDYAHGLKVPPDPIVRRLAAAFGDDPTAAAVMAAHGRGTAPPDDAEAAADRLADRVAERVTRDVVAALPALLLELLARARDAQQADGPVAPARARGRGSNTDYTNLKGRRPSSGPRPIRSVAS